LFSLLFLLDDADLSILQWHHGGIILISKCLISFISFLTEELIFTPHAFAIIAATKEMPLIVMRGDVAIINITVVKVILFILRECKARKPEEFIFLISLLRIPRGKLPGNIRIILAHVEFLWGLSKRR